MIREIIECETSEELYKLAPKILELEKKELSITRKAFIKRSKQLRRGLSNNECTGDFKIILHYNLITREGTK